MSDALLRCDCGYLCRGRTAEEQAEDGRRHARTVHGIDVQTDQVLAAGTALPDPTV